MEPASEVQHNAWRCCDSQTGHGESWSPTGSGFQEPGDSGEVQGGDNKLYQ